MAGSWGHPLPAISLEDILFDWQTSVELQKTIAYLSIALLMVAAYSDIRTLRIPNLLVGLIAVVGVMRLVVLADPIAVLYAVVFGIVVFAIGCLLFSRRIIGGGDLKLLTATILLIWYRDLFNFLALMSVVGALLSFAVILINSYLPLVSGPRLAGHLPKGRLPVPYGVAIAGAGIVTLLYQPLLFRYGW
jgi:prepilin peptidase CpaA